jgi:TonB family protein
VAVSTSPAAEPSAKTGEAHSAGQAPPAILESPAGLKSQLEAVFRTAKTGDSKQFNDMMSNLQIPESASWFSTTFGEETGAKLATTYKNSWEAYKDLIAEMFRNLGVSKHNHVFVKEFSSSSVAPTDNFIHAILQNAKSPLVLYTAGAGKDRENDTLPGVYVYVQGAFRVVNWSAFYDLPNVKPMRIRVSSSVAQAQLVHQVKPTFPAGAHQQHGQGTVVLRAIIDRDGNVARLEPVSGPPELIQAAEEAVRQWRFKPTVLNGDPVEMDTTFTITFSSGG